MAISSNFAPFFWVNNFIRNMLMHNRVITWQKELFIYLLSNAVLDLDNKSYSKLIHIQVIQDIYAVLNDIGIPFEELYLDDKAKKFLDILNYNQQMHIHSLEG